MDLLLRRRAMFPQLLPGRRLPSGYTEVSFLESRGNANVVTNVQGECEVHLTAQCLSPTSTSQLLVHFASSSGGWAGQNGSLWATGPSNRTTIASTQRADIEIQFVLPTMDMIVNGEHCQRSVTGNPFAGGRLTLFGMDSFWFVGKIFGDVVCLKNGVEVFRGVPCISPNNVAGYYDLITNQFFAPGRGTLYPGL